MDVVASSVEAPLLDLNGYDISHETGFLSESPLTKLPGLYFDKWEELLAELPDHVKRKTLRVAIHQLPEVEFNDSTLKSREEWKRAYLLLCFLGQGYIWMDGETSIVDTVPRKIAVPWCSVSAYLGILPVGTYSSAVLLNYKARDLKLPLDNLANLDALHTFTGTDDENFFYIIHVLVELAATPVIQAIATIYNKMHINDVGGVMEYLKIIADSIVKITKVTGKMYEGCNRNTFYVEIRPFLAGSVAFPNGITYEGVYDVPKKFRGASGAQSSILHMLDNFLGISHSGETFKTVNSMVDYMPQGHREFLTKLKDMPSMHDFCKQSGHKELIDHFNDVVKALLMFRKKHLVLVHQYIIKQKDSINPSSDPKGTGGAELREFFEDVLENTSARVIQMPQSY